MSNISEYKDILAFHPGYYILDIIEDMDISHEEFATRMGTTAKTLSKLLNGKANISNDLAKKLSSMLGTSAEVWLNLQNTYDKMLIEIEREKDFDSQVSILNKIDYKYFVDVAKLPDTKNSHEKIENLCKFLKVSDLRILLQPDFLVNFRSSVACIKENNIINSRAWIQTAINLSKDIKTKPYQKRKLKSYLPEIRKMTKEKPNEFLPRMKEIFSECGIAFILLPPLKDSGVNGAVKWLRDDRVVLAMNSGEVDIDKFWFSLFHEIGHILQKKIKAIFINSSIYEMIDINNSMEIEADIFSRNYLIPKMYYEEISSLLDISDEDIISFSRKIGVHPSIVSSRLQDDGIIKMDSCSKFKGKYFI